MTEYSRRQRRGITKLALRLLADDPLASEDARTKAADALAHLDGQVKPRETIWEHQVQPGLFVVVEDSTNILLELRDAGTGELLARSEPVNVAGLPVGLALAQVAAQQARDDAEHERLRGVNERQRGRLLAEPRDGEDAASRAQATAELAAAGLDAHSAQLVLRRAYGHLGGSFNVPGSEVLGTTRYDRETGTYAVRLPASQGDGLDGWRTLYRQQYGDEGALGRPEPELLDRVHGQGDGPRNSTDDYPASCYEVHAGIRPPSRTRGQVRAVIQEKVPGGGLELWHCRHNHAPGLHRVQDISPAQLADIIRCGREEASQRIAAGTLTRLPVVWERFG